MNTSRELKRCLVTGASGFVGKVLCEQLLRDGVFVRALLRNEKNGPWNEVVICDLANFEKHEEELFQDIDTIFYLSSIAHNKASIKEYNNVNVKLCLRFAEAAKRAGVKGFVYVSSTKAVAEPYEEIINEKFQLKPKDDYGLSKRHAEEGLLAMNGFEHLVIVRPCLVYGAGVQGNLHTMLAWINKGYFPSLPERGARRSMISVRNVASALTAVAVSPIANKKIYFLTDKNAYSIKEIEISIRNALDKKPFIVMPFWPLFFLAKTGDLIKSITGSFLFTSETLYKLLGSAQFSSEKIQKELRWEPKENFFQVLPEMIAEFSKQNKER